MVLSDRKWRCLLLGSTCVVTQHGAVEHTHAHAPKPKHWLKQGKANQEHTNPRSTHS